MALPVRQMPRMKLFAPIIFFFLLLLESCGRQPVVNSARATSTATIVPANVHMVSLSKTPAVIVDSTSTAVISPTLDEIGKEGFILAQISNNGGCSLPCWWGITPGGSLWSDVSNNFLQLGFKSAPIPGTSNYGIGGFALYSINTYSEVVFGVESNVINNIHVAVYGELEPEKFQAAYSYYSPEEILTNYGPPSRILLNIPSWGYGDHVGYSFWLFYEHLDFLIIFSGSAQRADSLQICPSFGYDQSISGIHLYLKSPGDDLSLDVLSNSGHSSAKTFEESVSVNLFL
jgi:hypothetical protein